MSEEITICCSADECRWNIDRECKHKFKEISINAMCECISFEEEVKDEQDNKDRQLYGVCNGVLNTPTIAVQETIS